MRVLTIGQLPKEIGGNYTTGAANVVYELSIHPSRNVENYTFGTNISNGASKKASKYAHQYIGYAFRPLSIIAQILLHPLRSLRSIKHYRRIDHQNVFRFFFYEDNIRYAIQAVRPDIIHVHSITNLSPTRFALDGKKVPVVLTCHGIMYKGDPKDENNRVMYAGNLKLADYYTGSTKETADEYEKYLGIPKSKVAIIPNGIDYKKIVVDSDSRDALR